MLRAPFSFAFAPQALSGMLLPTALLCVWGGVAFSAVSWGLRWSAMGQSPSGITQVVPGNVDIDTSQVGRTLGAIPVSGAAAPSWTNRLQLQGVLVGDASQGVALIAVDGKPAKPYRLGAQVAEGLILQSVQARRVNLGATVQGAPSVVLDLPTKK